MERIKRFFLNEAATAEATSTVIMVAAVAILLAGVLVIYYGGFSTFASNFAAAISGIGIPTPTFQ